MKTMRVWLDTEFRDNGYTLNVSLDLISIGLVREDGKELYFENAGVNRAAINADPWLSQHVVPKLSSGKEKLLWVPEIAEEVAKFCSDIKPHFWAYFASYDWMLLCKLFGSMMDTPKTWTKFCGDVRQLMWHLNIRSETAGMPYLPEHEKHNALGDARWLRDMHLWIDEHYILTPGKRMLEEEHSEDSGT